MTDQQVRSSATPGHLLRAARRRYGWSVEDIAEELNLLPHVVEGLENDDYSVVAGHTYAVGYMRNYARLVGVTIDLYPTLGTVKIAADLVGEILVA